jgi:hypothetical protein
MSIKLSVSQSSRKVNRKIALMIILAVIVAVLLTAFSLQNTSHPKSTPLIVNIINGNVTLNAASYIYYNFSVPLEVSSVTIEGTFMVTDDNGNGIRVYVMDMANFNNWQNGRNSSKYYDSGQLNTGNMTVSLLSSVTYLLVYDNTFTGTPKIVTTHVDYYYLPFE